VKDQLTLILLFLLAYFRPQAIESFPVFDKQNSLLP
jgi:hypothetical protein